MNKTARAAKELQDPLFQLYRDSMAQQNRLIEKIGEHTAEQARTNEIMVQLTANLEDIHKALLIGQEAIRNLIVSEANATRAHMSPLATILERMAIQAELHTSSLQNIDKRLIAIEAHVIPPPKPTRRAKPKVEVPADPIKFAEEQKKRARTPKKEKIA